LLNDQHRQRRIGAWHPGEERAGRPVDRDLGDCRVLVIDLPSLLDRASEVGMCSWQVRPESS